MQVFRRQDGIIEVAFEATEPLDLAQAQQASVKVDALYQAHGRAALLVDLSLVSDGSLDTTQLEPPRKALRMAIVVGNFLLQAVGDSYRQVNDGDGIERRVFRSRDVAEGWLAEVAEA
jgi:hypothetical protein